jgi:hypothetical protein
MHGGRGFGEWLAGARRAMRCRMGVRWRREAGRVEEIKCVEARVRLDPMIVIGCTNLKY